MKILLISDVESKYLWEFFDPDNFKGVDLIISCGDLKAEYMSYIVTVMKVPLFYINGNHDEDFLINSPEGCDCIDDKFIKFKGIRIIGFGGSKKYSNGRFQYSEHQMKKRIQKMRIKIFLNKGFDILVTHAGGFNIGDAKDRCHEGFKAFNWLLDKYSPKYFFHGHTHLNYGGQLRVLKYKDTTVVNAYGYYLLEF
jgi:uncharacterized protein